MADINNFSCTGNLTRDPESQYMTDGKQITKFDIAIGGYSKDQVTFLKVEAWEKSAEIISNYVKKGHKIGITGRLKQDKFTNKEGQTVTVIKLVAEKITLLTKKEENNDNPYK